MAGASNQQVLEDLRQLKSSLSLQYRLQRFFLFGSRARNEELLTSDVDLVVVSEDFRGTKFRHRPEKVLEFWPDAVDLEVLCYTPDEFERMKQRIGVVQQAAKDAVEI
jgi:predicted nucleotidyltransferase